MNLKNYTSTVPASTSMSKIEKCLVAAGATDISKKYEGSICVAISFRMMVNIQPYFFKLPARVDACFKVLWAEVKQQARANKQNYLDQAERTSWKIISDWVEVQLSMIQLEQADALQIFLPYVYDTNADKTFYDKLNETGFKLLN